jgi:hypothetical protein
MKFTKIVGFGDSWTHGDELLDPVLEARVPGMRPWWEQNTRYRESHCFLGKLSQHYQVPAVNFGIPGGSLQSTIWAFLWWLEHEPDPAQCLVLVGLTDPDRFSHYNPTQEVHNKNTPWDKFVHSIWVRAGCNSVPRDFQLLVKQQTVLTSSSELDHYNYLQSTLLFDGVCRSRQIPMLQFHVAHPRQHTRIDTPSLIWPDKNLAQYFVDKPQCLKPQGHPNEQGHEIIRDLLIPAIDRAILHK